MRVYTCRSYTLFFMNNFNRQTPSKYFANEIEYNWTVELNGREC